MKSNRLFKILCIMAMLTSTACDRSFIGFKKSQIDVVNPTQTEKKIVFEKKETRYEKDNTTDVLIDSEEVAEGDIAKVVKHGDHWHVFTKSGKEIITYKDPTNLKHLSEIKDTVNLVSSETLKKSVNSSEVVRILRHGDHWHIYTAGGAEYITHNDPSGLFPGIAIGNYVGNHANQGTASATLASENTGNTITVNPLENNEVLKKLLEKNSGIVSVLTLAELSKLDIKEILLHETHWHCYTANRTNEFIVNENPQSLFPNIKIGLYDGNHNHTNIDETKIDWPEDIDEIIDHKDHWHLRKNGKDLVVVQVDPREHYADRINNGIEYIVENTGNGNNHEVLDSELFDVNTIVPMLNKKIARHIEQTDLKNMEHFGDIPENGMPVYGSDGVRTNVFYWLHGNHYHAISLKKLIQNTKAGEYGSDDPKAVVATMKYMMEHKGESFEEDVTVDYELIQDYLADYYHIVHVDSQFFRFGNMVTVYNEDMSAKVKIHLSLFQMKGNLIETTEPLPELAESKNIKNPEITEDTSNSEKEEKKPIKEVKTTNDEGLTEAQVKEKYSKLYQLTIEQLEDVLFELPAGANFITVHFHSDGTAEYEGKIYNIIEIAKQLQEDDEEIDENSTSESIEHHESTSEVFEEVIAEDMHEPEISELEESMEISSDLVENLEETTSPADSTEEE